MNRRIFAVLFVFLVGVVALGFYRGWFTVSRRGPDAGSSKVNVNLTMDPDKIEQDAETVKKKAGELVGKVKDSTPEADESVKEPAVPTDGKDK